MRLAALLSLPAAAALAVLPLRAQPASPSADDDAAVIRRIYDAALVDNPSYARLAELVAKYPGRLAGSKSLEGAVQWSRALLEKQGVDRTELQPVMVPHWERGPKESVRLGDEELAALALGGSVPTPAGGLTAPVVEVKSLDELKTTDVRGKIVFFNRPMDPAEVNAGKAYGGAGDQRGRGPAEAGRAGAVGALVRSLTHATDDVPHTGNTTYLPNVPRIPAAALSPVAADQLSAALKAEPGRTVSMAIHSTWHPDALSHNVIGEIRGREHPEKVILIGGHLDSWDIAPGAHDDGTGCIQSIDVLRLLRAAGYTPRHTIRVVLFTNEENGLRGGTEYARVVGEKKEEHLLALETDSGGFDPAGFNLGNAAGDAHLRAARWAPLFASYGIRLFEAGRGGADVGPLLRYGYTVAGLVPNSQRYFDTHHTVRDNLDLVNRRELELGAAAMAALVYLVDRHGL